MNILHEKIWANIGYHNTLLFQIKPRSADGDIFPRTPADANTRRRVCAIVNPQWNVYVNVMYKVGRLTFSKSRYATASNAKKDTPTTLSSVLVFSLLYCPGEIRRPCALESCAQPPARTGPPFFCANCSIRFSNSGRKCRIRPWIGHANASPRAIELVSELTVMKLE